MVADDLYSVAAQVIPLLLIAVLFEERAFEKPARHPTWHFLSLGVVVYAAVGEWVSVDALASDREPTELEKSVVLSAIALLFFWLIVSAARAPLEKIGDSYPWTRNLIPLAFLLYAGLVSVWMYTDVDLGPYLAGAAVTFFLVASVVFNFAVDREQWRAIAKRAKKEGKSKK